MKIYTKASHDVVDRIAHLIKLFYPDLQKIGLRVDSLFVSSDDEEDENPLTLNGYACYAVIKVVNTKRRALGGGDVELVIDEAKYLTMTDAQKDALLDHELHHVELQVTAKGHVKLDCCKRPKCGMRLHDRQFGWFDTIAQRHGMASIECQQAQKLVMGYKQVYFSFLETTPALKSGGKKRLE